jgi:glycosyltransferase involved in cell wall biosynthesis
MIKEKFGYIPKDQRKKILLICDDIRVHSGVATVAKEIVIHTAQHFNWVNMGGAINHPEAGKRFDLSQSTNDTTGLTDSSVTLYPVHEYGNPDLLRQLIKLEKPDAIMLITDPRYFVWLFAIENEIRRSIPITYLNIWDDYPAPLYNKAYYEACDLLMGISKQTVNINKLVLGSKADKKIIKYVPHGLNSEIFKPIDKNDSSLKEFKKTLFKGKEYDFAVLFNSRNIRRKQIPDTILAYKYFIDSLPLEQAKRCALVLHTDRVFDHGTDLEAVIELLVNEEQYNIIFTDAKYDSAQMNLLYNSTDCQILLTSNEGWGLSLTEAILAGNPVIANVTGGMQDQLRFEDENGEWFTPSPEIPSNHTGRYKKHGEWAFPVFPSTRTLVGSPPTPYIWDDICRPEDAAQQLLNVYNFSSEDRKSKGLKGREWAIGSEAGFTSEAQGKRVIEAFDELFATWKPREKFELINTNEVEDRKINHKLIY